MKKIYLFLKLIIFQKLFQSLSQSETECEYDTPIIKKEISNECISGGCTQVQYKNDYCSIENEKIKKQWLNNFITFEYLDELNYIDIYTSSSGNLISISSTTLPANDNGFKRFFYILKNNDGRGFFLDIDNDIDTPYFYYSHSDCSMREHPNIFTFNLNNGDEQEYIICISTNDDFEMFDLENEQITQKESYYFDIDHILSYVNILLKLDNGNYALSLIADDRGKNYFCLIILSFSSFLFPSSTVLTTKKYDSSNSKIVSCFESEHKYIICFYQDNLNNYQEIVFNQNYELQKNDTIVTGPLDVDNYFEGVHFTGETAAFLYYNNENKPTIIFKEYNINSENIVNHFNSIGQIVLNIQNPNTNVELNDLIKINDYKICFTSVNEDKKDLYLTIINNYDRTNEKIKIRYYTIHMYNLYIYEIQNKLSTTVYNGFISLASSFSTKDGQTYNSATILLFSYPNSEDFDINLNDNFIIDLNSKCQIVNNIFGLIYNGIKLIDISEGYNLLSTKNGRELSIGKYIYEDEKIIVDLSNIANIPENGRIIFALEVKDPSYNIYNDYAYSIQNIGGDTEESFFEPKTYIGRHSYCDITKINEDLLTQECEVEYCNFCLTDHQTCISCEYKLKLSEEGNKIICLDETSLLDEDSTIPENENINNDNEKKINCTIEEIKNNECKGTITINQIEEIKNDLLNSNRENEIIKTEKIIIQFSTFEAQKYSENSDVSSIDLRECENILKNVYNIPKDESLIIFKLDIKTEDLLSTYAYYEIYSPLHLTILNLDLCNEVEIIINTPVILDDSLELIYNSLSESGYNLFDGNDSFYQDICAVYTTINGTDMILSDRKKDLYTSTQNTTICQTGCEFEKYNSKTKKAKCNCNIKNEKIIDLYVDDLFDKKEIEKSFYNTLSNSNFRVLKCIRLIFSSKIIKNVGEILMTIILFAFIGLNIYSCIKGPAKIHYYINLIIKNCEMNQNPESQKSNEQIYFHENTPKELHKIPIKKIVKKIKIKKKKKKIILNKENIHTPPKKVINNHILLNEGELSKKSEDINNLNS